jgi:hypothetical protein
VEPDTEHFAITYSVAAIQDKPDDSSMTAMDVMYANTGRIITIFPLAHFGVRSNFAGFINLMPQRAGRVRITVDYLLAKALVNTPRGAELIAANEERTRMILGEDTQMMLRLQKNSTTAFTQMGRLSQLEEAVWRFYKYLARQLFDDPKELAAKAMI